ncbi:MAG TPA: DUF2752 domain-containing protein [Phycisphaerales bacterium]|nr:DUF2752 domain-containing protein [Phycisphaerales bacterium]
MSQSTPADPAHGEVVSTSPVARIRKPPAEKSTKQRVLAGLVGTLLLAWLVVGASLRPDVSGMGTHRQLGLPPCGWIVAFNRPCPTCGMTTAFSAAAQGKLQTALVAQPFGALLALAAATGVWVCWYAALTGSSLPGVYAFLLRPRWVWLMFGLLAISWVYKLMVASSGVA